METDKSLRKYKPDLQISTQKRNARIAIIKKQGGRGGEMDHKAVKYKLQRRLLPKGLIK